MAIPISVDAGTGSISLGTRTRLEPLQQRAAIEPLVADLVRTARDHGNGFAWLYLQGLSFGEHPASLALGFHSDLLEHVGWTVDLLDADRADGWPTRAAIEAEITFVRDRLAKDLGFNVRKDAKRFAWGEVWSHYDPKGGSASHGLRYRVA